MCFLRRKREAFFFFEKSWVVEKGLEDMEERRGNAEEASPACPLIKQNSKAIPGRSVSTTDAQSGIVSLECGDVNGGRRGYIKIMMLHPCPFTPTWSMGNGASAGRAQRPWNNSVAGTLHSSWTPFSPNGTIFSCSELKPPSCHILLQ